MTLEQQYLRAKFARDRQTNRSFTRYMALCALGLIAIGVYRGNVSASDPTPIPIPAAAAESTVANQDKIERVRAYVTSLPINEANELVGGAVQVVIYSDYNCGSVDKEKLTVSVAITKARPDLAQHHDEFWIDKFAKYNGESVCRQLARAGVADR